MKFYEVRKAALYGLLFFCLTGKPAEYAASCFHIPKMPVPAF